LTASFPAIPTCDGTQWSRTLRVGGGSGGACGMPRGGTPPAVAWEQPAR
jgi:hypothetical protein